MRFIRIFFYIFSLSTLFYSCQKEVDLQDDLNPGGGGTTNPPPGGGNNNQSIIGDYDFVGISAATNTTVNVTDGGQNLKTIAKSNYVSTNNAGTAKVTNTEFVFTDIVYKVSTTARV